MRRRILCPLFLYRLTGSGSGYFKGYYMNLNQIYDYIERIGCLTFSTQGSDGFVHSRIAHFFAYDNDGFYFRTMYVKPFYRELKESGSVTVSGIYPQSQLTEKNYSHEPEFSQGYTFRMYGNARELTADEVKEKYASSEKFKTAVYDMKKYPATRCFLLYRGKGEIYDYDFEKKFRSHKILRKRFSFGGLSHNDPGMRINGNCIACGRCYDICTFDAVRIGNPFSITGERCEECGSCYETCPRNAVELPRDL